MPASCVAIHENDGFALNYAARTLFDALSSAKPMREADGRPSYSVVAAAVTARSTRRVPSTRRLAGYFRSPEWVSVVKTEAFLLESGRAGSFRMRSSGCGLRSASNTRYGQDREPLAATTPNSDRRCRNQRTHLALYHEHDIRCSIVHLLSLQST